MKSRKLENNNSFILCGKPIIRGMFWSCGMASVTRDSIEPATAFVINSVLGYYAIIPQIALEINLYVICTAGHVDHGKSTLVRALTGIDPDRLHEEKVREMTIDLGFAWLNLPSGESVSIVDVPGHERFIKNMLAGVGGIDAALFVIAADEGVMPQTAEHASILKLLGVDKGIVALTKCDLVERDWLDLVTEEVREWLGGTSLSHAEIVPVSSRKRDGLDVLLAGLDAILESVERLPGKGEARLPIDRVFSMQGFGTVVTGTLIDGPLDIGQEIRVLPKGIRTRVRGMQTNKQAVEHADAGRRLAVNLANVELEDLSRGDTLVASQSLRPTNRLDARITLVEHTVENLPHGRELNLFVGTSESPATVSLLDRDNLKPGEHCYAQLRTVLPVTVLRGDRFILRQPSPSITVGGGVVLDAHPLRHRRKTNETLAQLEAAERGTPTDLITAWLARYGPSIRVELLSGARGVTPQDLDEAVSTGEVVSVLTDEGKAESTLLFTRAQWDGIASRFEAALRTYHQTYPLRSGMPKEELRSKVRLDARVFNQAISGLSARGVLEETGTSVKLRGFEITLSPAQQHQADRAIAMLKQGGYTPPPASELGLEPELLASLVEAGSIVKLGEGLYYDPDVYRGMVDTILRKIDISGAITVSETRDTFGASRKYALGLLEHLDAMRVTRRVGDERVRR